MRSAVITLAHGRHEHLLLQCAGLRHCTRTPDRHVAVAMGDDRVRPLLARHAPGAEVLELAAAEGSLPLARARNLGAERALDDGAELLIFLDVDCVPAPRLIERYEQAAAAAEHGLLCGPVGYLPPPPAGGYRLERLPAQACPHPARPVPREDELRPAGDTRLFWSLSFAVAAADWRAVGGFCEEYRGYGGEDTDFAQLAVRAGLRMLWVGGAWAYHQHHAGQGPPVRHAREIVENANLFHSRWGWWPMEGWLDQFAERGVARFEPTSARWRSVEGRGPVAC
jgi:N-acetylglucosaminyl-diphospho-decaprenol L-rhamnosyltransferase